MRGVRKEENYKNPCLTMHQPWASLLVYGIKRIEGRSWPAPLTGRLWIHAASKVPEEATIKAMEDFYRQIYALDGVTDIDFPQHYPVSRLLGCVEVVGCVRREEVVNWEAIPQSVRLEGQTDFCWLCENPQRLIVPFEMRGYQRVYNLERKIYESAVRGLTRVKSPLPVKFPLPDPRDPHSLKPGSISASFPQNRSSTVGTSSSLTAAIAGAQAAATQFNKKNQYMQKNIMDNQASDTSFTMAKCTSRTSEDEDVPFIEGTSTSARKEQSRQVENAPADVPFVEETSTSTRKVQVENAPEDVPLIEGTSISTRKERSRHVENVKSSTYDQHLSDLKHRPGPTPNIFAAAMRGLKPA